LHPHVRLGAGERVAFRTDRGGVRPGGHAALLPVCREAALRAAERRARGNPVTDPRTRTAMPARAVVAAALLLAPLTLSAQQREGASFYLIFGKDTIVQERLVRTPTRIDGELLDRVRNSHLEFNGTLTNDALISRLELTQHTASGDTSAQKQ